MKEGIHKLFYLLKVFFDMAGVIDIKTKAAVRFLPGIAAKN